MTTTERGSFGAGLDALSEEERKAAYTAHLKSDYWASLRTEARMALPYRCAVKTCRFPHKGLMLHHRHYRTFGRETLTDVEWLCEWHHRHRHRAGSRKRKEKSQ